MAILTTMNGIPLFTSIGEALAWSRANGLKGYHTHKHRTRIGYMGGTTHLQAAQQNNVTNQVASPKPQVPPVIAPSPAPIVQQQVAQSQPITPLPPQINYNAGGSGGGGY